MLIAKKLLFCNDLNSLKCITLVLKFKKDYNRTDLLSLRTILSYIKSNQRKNIIYIFS